MSCYPRFAPALLALALLSASPALSQSRPGAAPPSTASFAEALRGFLPDFLVRRWGNLESSTGGPGSGRRTAARIPATSRIPTSVWAAEGCGLDPYGHCLNLNTTPQPNGH
jgi:hypothetical protein